MITNPNHPNTVSLQNIVSNLRDSYVQAFVGNDMTEMRRDELFDAFQIVTCFEFDALCHELNDLHYWTTRRTNIIDEIAHDDSANTIQMIKHYGDACAQVALHRERANNYRNEIQDKMGSKAWNDAKTLYHALTGCDASELEYEVR